MREKDLKRTIDFLNETVDELRVQKQGCLPGYEVAGAEYRIIILENAIQTLNSLLPEDI